MTDKLLEEISARGIATLTLNRPDVANTYDQDMLDALFEAFGRLGRDDSVRAVVLRGAGKHFCGGGDQRRTAASPDAPTMVKVCERARAVPPPTVAVISGACIGGALALVSCCDIRIASSDAFFAMPEVRLGFATTPATVMPIVRAMGVRAYRRYAMTGQRFHAEEALRIGLLHETCESGVLDQALEAQAEEILLAAPGAARSAKRMADALEPAVPADAFEGIVTGRNTAEAREGIAAFREKRKPAWYR